MMFHPFVSSCVSLVRKCLAASRVFTWVTSATARVLTCRCVALVQPTSEARRLFCSYLGAQECPLQPEMENTINRWPWHHSIATNGCNNIRHFVLETETSFLLETGQLVYYLHQQISSSDMPSNKRLSHQTLCGLLF